MRILGEVLRPRWLWHPPVLVPLTIRPKPSLAAVSKANSSPQKAAGSSLGTVPQAFSSGFALAFPLGK